MRRSITSIKTDRLWLRQIDETDAEAIVDIRSDKNVYKYFLNPVKISIDDHRRWYNEQYKNDDNRIDWIAVDDKSGDFIGIYGAKMVERNTAEVSYITKPDKQGCGYAKEAVEAIIRWCVDYWGVNSAIVTINKGNKRSISFARHLEFRDCEEIACNRDFTVLRNTIK